MTLRSTVISYGDDTGDTAESLLSPTLVSFMRNSLEIGDGVERGAPYCSRSRVQD